MLALRKMPMGELHGLRSANHVITKEISGFLCQPRFDKGEAGDVLENIAEFLRSYEQAAVNVAISAKPSARWSPPRLDDSGLRSPHG